MFRHLIRAVLLSASLALAPSAAQAQAAGFARDDLASDVVRLEGALKSERPQEAAGKSALQLRREADAQAARGNPREALTALAAAVAADPKDWSAWAAFARAAHAVTPKDYDERYKLRERALAAAYAAYQRAGSKSDQAAALALLASLHADREEWRPALNAYRASLALNDDAALRSVYEDMRAKHGFRVLDYKVDSDSASPRVCFRFSDPLAAGKVDLAPFVAVAGAANAAVTNEASQLCVEGLRHGQRYAFVLREGLPSSVGENLLKSADYDVYVRDRAPQVRFTGRNYVLPRTGQEGIPLVSVNTERVEIEIARIGDRNLLPTLRSEEFLSQLGRSSAEALAQEKGVRLWTGTVATRSELNQDVVTAFPVLEAVGGIEPGVYVMSAKPSGVTAPDQDHGPRATQWFVVSDLGLTAFKGGDGVHVFVRSLASAEPLAGVEVRLVARNNEVLASRPTDAKGHAAFDPGLARGTGGLAPGLVVATTAGGDYGFLDLAAAAFDLTDRGVRGRPAPRALDAFLYTERGVYRSGEIVHATALLRDATGAAVSGLPLTLVVKRPDGVEYRRAQVEDQGLGGRSLSVPLLPSAMTGTWRIAAYTDPKAPAVGEASFLVQDYVPERLDVTLTPRSASLVRGQPAIVGIEARYLYGAPGAGLEVSGEVVVQAAAKSGIPGLDGFGVGLEDEEVEAATAELEDPATTDSGGRATVQAPVQDLVAPRPTEAKITLRVGEPGGRAVERSLTLPILPSGPVIGVRKTFGGDLAEGAVASFDVVLANPDGSRLSRPGVVWTLSRVERRYQWFNEDGRWGYEPVRSTRRVADGTLDLGAAEPGRIAQTVTWGTYRLEVRAPGLETAQTSVTFTVGWSGDQTADTPDLLDVKLDKAAYRAGDVLEARLSPRFAGKATIAVVSDRLRELRVVDLAREGTTVRLPVSAEWGSGAYLVALAHRPLEEAARRMPGRALGLAWFALDPDAHRLDVRVETPDRVRPRGTLSVPVRIAGLGPGEEARVTVAAVDVGILNLTRYPVPDPFEHVFGQKQLATEIRDLYGYLVDGMQGTRGAIRSGGDMGAKELSGSPPTQEPLARYSGVVRVGPDGSANVSFDLPAFNGTARVMAVAWSGSRVGRASADVIVRDPVVVSATLPRFLSIGDRSRLQLDIHNVEGPAGEYTLDVDLGGPVLVAADALHRSLHLGAGERASFVIPVTAAGPGTGSLQVRLSGAGAPPLAQELALNIRPGTGSLVRRIVRGLEPGAALSVSSELLADIVPGTGALSVSVSPLGGLDVPGLLAALDRYPYGCTEQIVSRALPLLYVNRLAAAGRLALDDKADERIRDAIERVLARQGPDGSFGLWSVGGEDVWLAAYATDFLTRARERKFAVPPRALEQALDRLRNFVANVTDAEKNGPELAYATYVLARSGRPVMGDLRYLADTGIGALGTPLARAQLGAALALLGDRARAQAAFAAAYERLRGTPESGASRADYGTRLRDGAGLLALAAESNLARDTVAPVSRIVDQERASRGTTSTQENAWLVLAAEALGQEADALALEVNGEARRGAFYRTWSSAELGAGPATIRNAGSAPIQIVLNVTGHPIGPEPAASEGYAVERTYYRLDGSKADPAQVRQNERLVTVLKVTESAARAARVLLVDRLPAGFEIDNPSLVDSGKVEALSWLTRDVEPVHTEYRDDRFVAAFERTPEQPAFFTVAYVVRAVSPGRYVHPSALVEDMYRPDRFGRTAYGTVEVAPARP